MSESTAGRMLLRSWMLSKHRYNPKQLGNDVMHVHETPRHALSNPSDEREEQAAREGYTAKQLALLSADERAVLELQARGWTVEQERRVEPAQVQALLDEGWCYVKQEEGMVVLKGDFTVTMTYTDIGERLGLSARRVHRRVVSAHKKLRRAR